MQKTSKDSMIEAVRNDFRTAQENTKERAYLYLLERNAKLKRQLDFWSGISVLLALLIVLTLVFRSI